MKKDCIGCTLHKKIEVQRKLLYIAIREENNLTEIGIISESRKLDMFITECMKCKQGNANLINFTNLKVCGNY